KLFALLNPIHHGGTSKQIAIYKVEPYVVSADVYAVAPHTGRGGWTWYTGAAGWLYRLIVESLLGLKREGDRLHIKPCMPYDWKSYSLSYRYGTALYRIDVVRSWRAKHTSDLALTLDGVEHDLH